MNTATHLAASENRHLDGGPLWSRRSLMHSSCAAALLAPWARFADAALRAPEGGSSGAGSAPASGGQDPGLGAAGGDIVLGTSAAFTGPSRGLGNELYRGAMAYFSHLNESGGVGGRRVALKLYDDGYQPDPCVQNTLKLMLEDQVFLLFGYVGTPTVTRVLPMLKKFQEQQVYMFFPFTGAQPQREPPYGDFAFNLRASYRQETAGLVENFLATGRRRIAVFYQADAYGRSGWAGVRAALENHGETIAGEATYQRGARFTGTMRAQVEILQKASPDAVICVGAYAACAAFARDAIDLGLRVPIANLSFVGSENLVNLLSEGRDDPETYTRWLVNSQVVPSYEDESVPAVREYRELMGRHDPQIPEQFLDEPYEPLPQSFVSLEGFMNAKLLSEIFRRFEGAPTRAGLEDAVFSIRDFDLGIGEQVSFGPDRRQGLQRVYYTVVEEGRFVPLTDWNSLAS